MSSPTSHRPAPALALAPDDSGDEPVKAENPHRPPLPSRLSPAALASYRRCPRQFLFKHVMRVPERERPSPHLVVANAVHHALERFFGLRPQERTRDVLHQALRWAWPQHRKPGAFGNVEEERECGLKALAILDTFISSFDTTAVPLARERWVQTRLPNGMTVFGKVDRIDGRVRPNDRSALTVIDYKTGRCALESADLPDESAVQVYAAATEDETHREVERVRYLYVAEGEEARFEPEREDIDLAREKLLAITDTIRADHDFEALPGPHCGWCPFNLQCPDASRVELTDLEGVEDVGF